MDDLQASPGKRSGGGRSKHLATPLFSRVWFVLCGFLAEERGFPGASSHRKGTEPAMLTGGVANPGVSYGLFIGYENRGSLGVEQNRS